MDQETLVNHIKNLSETYFNVACGIVLKDYFNVNAINVDGSNDGGADFITVGTGGERTNDVYQLTTQKDKVPEKLGKDVKKAVEKLNAKRFYFLTSHNTSEVISRKLEHQYSSELGIPVTFYSARHIAGFLLEDDLLNKFLDKVDYPLPRSFKTSPDYKEMALHGYSVMSEDSKGMRQGIYDDTILFILSEQDALTDDEIVENVIKFLHLPAEKEINIKERIGALFAKGAIERTVPKAIRLSQSSVNDVLSRKRIYEQELMDLSAAQTDIMRRDFGIDWTLTHSREVSIFIADAYILQQMELLEDIKAKIAIEPILRRKSADKDLIRGYIQHETGLTNAMATKAAYELVENASNHPLITKLARASVYVALEGRSPIASAKSLGASRWSDFSIMVEPSVVIPWICAQLYSGDANIFFKSSKSAVTRALKLDAKLFIPYYYINECASHLLRARNYTLFDYEDYQEELQHSPNAFIAHYYALKKIGVKIPGSILEYLKTFSPAVQTEKQDWKSWARSIMPDIQSILTKSGVNFVEIPFYNPEDCANFQQEYTHYLSNRHQQKSRFLMDHDIWALQFTHSETQLGSSHWAILTFDKAMIKVGAGANYAGWIVTPDRFLDITSTNQNISDIQYTSLIHSLAISSDRTLALGARIIDRVVTLASDKLQNWEFKNEFDAFRKNLISEYDLEAINSAQEIDVKVDEFLLAKGVVPLEDLENKEDSEPTLFLEDEDD
jgi:hypothetical protein